MSKLLRQTRLDQIRPFNETEEYEEKRMKRRVYSNRHSFGLEFGKSQRAVENREKWRKLVAKSSVVPQRPSRLMDWWWWWWNQQQRTGHASVAHTELESASVSPSCSPCNTDQIFMVGWCTKLQITNIFLTCVVLCTSLGRPVKQRYLWDQQSTYSCARVYGPTTHIPGTMSSQCGNVLRKHYQQSRNKSSSTGCN